LYLVLKALVIGMASYLVRRLGTSIILFTYLYTAHTPWFHGFVQQKLYPSAELRLAGFVIALGAFVILFRTAFTSYSRALDIQALPRIDRLTLIKVNRGDLLLNTLRQKSRAGLECAKALLVLAALVCLCLFLAPPVAFILVIVTILVSLLATQSGMGKETRRGWIGQMMSQPDNYVDIMLNTGLVIGFLLITKDGGLISGTVLILMVARFSSAIRTLATNITNLARWRTRDLAFWQKRQQLEEKRQAAEMAKLARHAKNLKKRDEARAARHTENLKKRDEARAARQAENIRRRAALAANMEVVSPPENEASGPLLKAGADSPA
jgi:hypothetical protein